VTINGLALNGINMNGISFNGANLNGVSLNGVNFNGIIINGVQLNGQTLNGVTLNGHVWNGVTLNGISYNGIVYEGVSIPGTILIGITLDFIRELFNNGTLQSNSSEVEILPYLVRCSLDPSDSFNVTINDTIRVFNGSFGLAPSFKNIPMTFEQQNSVSACLLSHVNFFGKHVLISIRNVPYIPAMLDEMAEFGVYEGAFFGNVFNSNDTMFSCIGDNEKYALVHSPDRVNRICTDNMTCGFYSMGLCSEACKGFNENYGYATCTGANGVDYLAMNVYLKNYPNALSSTLKASPATIALAVVVGVLAVALVGVSVITFTKLH